MFKIQLLNTISMAGLSHFPHDLYEVASESTTPDAILVRSKGMHEMLIPDSVKAIGRAGAGLNNIPLDALTKRGIPVFNTPGANANAVCELVIAGMLLASRHICEAWQFVNNLPNDESLDIRIENEKKQFVGFELIGKKLGVIGLGSVGVKVANSALNLGMEVIGYDPAITVNRAWELSSHVKQARSIDEVLMESDFLTFHVPLIDATKNMINQSRFQLLKKNVIILNFARDGIIDNSLLAEALTDGKVYAYVTDFPTKLLKDHPRVISLPHLGASTKEAEENCAVMIAKQVRAFLENGSITHSANFPTLEIPKNVNGSRIAIVNENVPNMVAQISAAVAEAGLNINSLYNKSRDCIAYTVIDLENDINRPLLQKICDIAGVMQLRVIESRNVEGKP